ncbi:hypothetical protein Q3G72_021227 [Acer saccharum]|nr:hypothetical protein Q3G72_021227 [Acer saccharum]
MGCAVIEVAPLTKREVLNLFLKHVGDDVYNVPTLKSTLEQVVKQCAGLPLAINVIGSSMRGEYDVHVWKNALNKLKKQAGSVERLLDEMETRQKMYDEGFSILKRLENNCLLESVEERRLFYNASSLEYVKMHDVVRDLALHITSESPRYLVKAGMQLEELPNEQEWKEDVEKVSLMHNRIKEISSDVTIPKCKALKTLLLQNNCDLERIHESFFTFMTGLTILDLSGNWKIKALPNSVSELQNLNALLLHYCQSLKYVPSLSKIRGLKKLDLGFTNIKEVPHGMEMLVHLRSGAAQGYLGL